MSTGMKALAVTASVLLAFLGVPLIHLDTAGAEEPVPATAEQAPADEVPAIDAADEAPAANIAVSPVAEKAAPDNETPVVDAAQTAEAAPQADAVANPLAQVVTDSGTTNYATLKEALEAAPAGATVKLLADTDIPSSIMRGNNISLAVDKAVTLDGQNHTLTVHGRGIYLTGGADVASSANYVIKNIAITNPDAYGRTVSARNGYKTLRFEAAQISATGGGNTQVFTLGGNTPQTTDVTFDGCTLKASEAGYGIITFNPINLTLADTDVSGYAALYMKGPDGSAGSSNSVVNIEDGSVLSSKGIAGPTNRFGTIVIQQSENVKVNVTNSTVEAQSNDAQGDEAAPQAVVMYTTYPAEDLDARAHDNSVTFGEGAKVNALGANSSLTTVNGNPNRIDATEGTYNLEGNVYDLPDQTAETSPTKVSVTGGHWNKDMKEYVPEGYETANTGDNPDAPFVVAPKSTEPTDPSQHAGEGSNPDNPDKTGNQGTEGEGGGGTDGTEGEGTGAPAENSDQKNTTATIHNGGSNGSAYRSGTGSSYHASTGARSSSFPRTADDQLPLALGVSAAALAAAGAAFVASRKLRASK